MQNAEETVELKDAHYQISLSFKDRVALVPNNKSQALQRANWLKKRLERDTKFCADQTSLEEGKAWYIPHHRVHHPHKPGKIQVVFDCSAK